jgi:hypothetical protein
VANADVISTIWSGTTCNTLVHELNCDQPKTTKELLDIAIGHASSKEAVGAAFILGNVKTVTGSNRVAPSKATVKSTRKGTKSGKKGQKQHPQLVAVTAGDGCNDEKADDSNEEYVMAAERIFKHQMRQPEDHFEKLLEATCPNHSYPVKH